MMMQLADAHSHRPTAAAVLRERSALRVNRSFVCGKNETSGPLDRGAKAILASHRLPGTHGPADHAQPRRPVPWSAAPPIEMWALSQRSAGYLVRLLRQNAPQVKSFWGSCAASFRCLATTPLDTNRGVRSNHVKCPWRNF